MRRDRARRSWRARASSIRAGVKVARVGHSDGKIQAVIESSHGEETIEGIDLLVAAGPPRERRGA